jgi:hypothetical protein
VALCRRQSQLQLGGGLGRYLADVSNLGNLTTAVSSEPHMARCQPST